MANNIKIDKEQMFTVLLGVGGGIVLAYIVSTVLNKAVLPKIAPKFFEKREGIDLVS